MHGRMRYKVKCAVMMSRGPTSFYDEAIPANRARLTVSPSTNVLLSISAAPDSINWAVKSSGIQGSFSSAFIAVTRSPEKAVLKSADTRRAPTSKYPSMTRKKIVCSSEHVWNVLALAKGVSMMTPLAQLN